MPEYFDISLIIEKTSTSGSELEVCLKQFGSTENENNPKLFGKKKIIVSHFEDEESDFDEISIGIPKKRFNKETFENELEEVTDFVNSCFACAPSLKYALCSYELNGYLIGRFKKIQDFNNDDFLRQFPIVYRQMSPLEKLKLEVNIKAQEIF